MPDSAATETPASAKAAKDSSAAPAARRRRRRAAGGRRLFAFDRGLGTRLVAGADEAGRGCLAGPLVAAAVMFDLETLSPDSVQELGELDDSKRHSDETRERLYPLILAAAERVTVVSRCARGIDSRGLHRTNLTALADALRGVSGEARESVSRLVDGFSLPDLALEHTPVVGGDGKSAAIAAASIVAKVTRDRFMRHADALHPGWSFAEHVGYSTPAHRAAIARLGVSPLHRLSFQSTAYDQLTLAGM